MTNGDGLFDDEGSPVATVEEKPLRTRLGARWQRGGGTHDATGENHEEPVGRARRWRTALVVAALVGLLVVGWIAASRFQSPEQRAAEARPPEEGPIVAEVTHGELVDLVNVRADIGFESEDVIAGPAQMEGQVVTETFVRPGDEVRPGAAVVAVNDRPVFILPGQFPLYRDIEPGMEGRDVEQLQAAMQSLGYSIPDYEAGWYGWSTRQAVADLYEAAGFDQITVPDPDAVAEAPAADPTQPAEAPAAGPASPDAASAVATQPEPATTPTPPPQIGPVLPMSEVVVAPQLPARLVALPSIGERVGQGEGFVTLASGPLVARAELDAAAMVRLEPGTSATLVSDHGDRVEATIASREPTTADAAAGAPASPSESGPAEPVPSGGQGAAAAGDSGELNAIVFAPAEPLPADWLGANVLVEVRIEEVAGDGLLVPERAVSTGTDGSQRVYVKRAAPDDRDEDEFVRVNVEVVGTLAGQAAIRPVDEGALAEGDEVRVG